MQTFSIIPAAQLIILVATVVAAVLLAFIVVRTNFKSATNISFLFLSLSTIGWLVSSGMFLSRQDPGAILNWARISIFFAAPMSML
ncbi:MAG: hypothetical protein Q8P97_00870, partial [bacterium]|nr:hypothetical protein [bacterium]